jgi:hypothetical protein
MSVLAELYIATVNVSGPVPPLAIANVAVTWAFPAAREKLVIPLFPPGLMPFATAADAAEAGDVP